MLTLTPARRRLLLRMYRHNGVVADHQLCDHDRRIVLRMVESGLVFVAKMSTGDVLYYVHVLKGGRAA